MDTRAHHVWNGGHVAGFGVITAKTVQPKRSRFTDTFYAELVNAHGTVLTRSNPITIRWNKQPDGTNYGYLNYRRQGVYQTLTGLTNGTATETVHQTLESFGFQHPRYQFWQQYTGGTAYGQAHGYVWHLTKPGIWYLTGFAEGAHNLARYGPGTKPYDAKAHTFFVAVGEPDTAPYAKWTASGPYPLQPTMDSTITLTATKSYPYYQFWYSPRGGLGHWFSSGNYQRSNTFQFTPSNPGAYKVVVYGSQVPAGYPNTVLGSFYINVNS